jgi:hypothetical protein
MRLNICIYVAKRQNLTRGEKRSDESNIYERLTNRQGTSLLLRTTTMMHQQYNTREPRSSNLLFPYISSTCTASESLPFVEGQQHSDHLTAKSLIKRQLLGEVLNQVRFSFIASDAVSDDLCQCPTTTTSSRALDNGIWPRHCLYFHKLSIRSETIQLSDASKDPTNDELQQETRPQ